MKQLIFNMNGAVDDTLTITVPEGLNDFPSVTPPVYPRPGVTFRGWGLSPTDEPYSGTTINVTTNITFFALWDGIDPVTKYEVIFKPNGANGEKYTIEYDADGYGTLPLTTEFTHPFGYDFAGWATTPDGPKVTTLLMNQDYIVYAMWKNNSGGGGSGGGGGTKKPSGKYVSANNGIITKVPVSEDGFLLLGSTCLGNKGGGITGISVMYQTYGIEKQFSIYQIPTDIKLKHPENLDDYTVVFELSGSGNFPFYIYDIWGCYYVENNVPYADLPGQGISGKTLVGWAIAPNSGAIVTDPFKVVGSVGFAFPVYRAGEPQFNVSIDNNDGSGEVLTFKNVENEIFFVDETIESQLAAPEGKIFAGLSTRRNGDPIYHKYIIINKNTTLYAIWKDE